jgi:CRP-like cAMP-binding protein
VLTDQQVADDSIDFFSSIFKELRPEDLHILSKISRPKIIRAGDIYIAEHSLSQRLSFIRKGMIRSYLITESGAEKTLMIRWENQLIASVDSILHQRPSRFIYQAMENTSLIEIDYRRSQSIIEDNGRLSAIRNRFLMEILAEAMERIENFVLLSPEECYLRLVFEKPDLVDRVHDKHLATMLGITAVSLSRIRKRIHRQNAGD